MGGSLRGRRIRKFGEKLNGVTQQRESKANLTLGQPEILGTPNQRSKIFTMGIL